jgi:hypothetical protein
VFGLKLRFWNRGWNRPGIRGRIFTFHKRPEIGWLNTGELKKTFGARIYPVECSYDYAGRLKTRKISRDSLATTARRSRPARVLGRALTLTCEWQANPVLATPADWKSAIRQIGNLRHQRLPPQTTRLPPAQPIQHPASRIAPLKRRFP